MFEIKQLFENIAHVNSDALKEKLKQQQLIKEKQHYIEVRVSSKIVRYEQWMLSKRYSDNTIKTYLEALKTFLKFFYQKPIETITNEDLIIFNNEYILKKKLSSSYQNQIVNAIKLFFRIIKNKSMD